MNIQSLSVVVGTKACNAKCPFCVSKMTGFDVLPNRGAFDLDGLYRATKMAQIGGASTLMITGKGEPTLYPDNISAVLRATNGMFPLVELQTNGIAMAQGFGLLEGGASAWSYEKLLEYLSHWQMYGLTTIAISTAGFYTLSAMYALDWDEDMFSIFSNGVLTRNREFYCDPYFNVEELIGKLRERGFTVRVCAMSVEGGVDTPEKARVLASSAFFAGAAQTILRPITAPVRTKDATAYEFVQRNRPTDFDHIQVEAEKRWRLLLTLADGGLVYETPEGHNLALGNCLTVSGKSKDIRSLVFYGDGRITFGWEENSMTLLSPNKRSNGQ